MSITHSFACDTRAQQVLNLAKEILGDLWVIQVLSLKLSENFETSEAKIDVKLVEYDGKPKKHSIHGEGVGLVDAYFDGMIKFYEKDFCSLDSISIMDFSISSHVEHGSKRRSDAKVTALLRIKNSQDHEYTFECTSSSVSHSSLMVVQEAVAFFINAELAYTRLHRAIINAKERGRNDLVTRYQNQMGTLVNATSYEKLVEKLKNPS
jgi:hypothetical protein